MKQFVNQQKGLTGIMRRRLFNATVFAWRGLRAGWRSEEALRLELMAAAILVPAALILPVSAAERALLVLVVALVLIVELLNSAVETAVDRIGPEFHELSGKAKDLASAAVFVSLMLVLTVWSIVLFPVFFQRDGF